MVILRIVELISIFIFIHCRCVLGVTHSCSRCAVSKVHGLLDRSAMGELVSDADEFMCATTCRDVHTKFYSFQGDAGVLNQAMNEDYEILIRIPIDQRESDSVINLDSLPKTAISLHNKRRRLSMNEKRKGEKKVLVVSVKDRAGNAPTQTREGLANDVFGIDVDNSNTLNMRERFLSCSKGKLSFNPVKGRSIKNGILEVTIDKSMSGLKYKDVSNLVLDKFPWIGNIQTDHIMFVLPDSVDFGGTGYIAWGQFKGTFTWFKSRVASFPMAQVHELSHNLGLHHSGHNGLVYGDATGTMGYEGNLSKDGSKMCFNGAKTWYNMWFFSQQTEVNPVQEEYDGSLVGIDDTVNNNIRSNQHVVVKINGDDSNGPTSYDLFIMYNRKKGINDGVPGFGDRVMITEQIGDSKQSWQRGALKSGSTYIKRNWHDGKSLIIKHCETKSGSLSDSARVLIYIEGLSDLKCPFEHIDEDILIRNQKSSQCIDLKKSSTENGNIIRLRSCQNLQRQKWKLGVDGYIRSALDENKCIVGKGGATKEKGTRMVIGECEPEISQFVVTPNGKIKSKQNKKLCIGRARNGVLRMLLCSNRFSDWFLT